MFTIKFETDNAAFEDDSCAEVARILRALASRIEQQGMITDCDGFAVIDSNGNTIGRVKVK
jgi:hypothetical protein